MITAKPGNILLWDYSLKNPENILDEYYFHDVSHLVIPATKSESDLASEYFVVEIEINKVIQEISTSTTESEQKIKLEKNMEKLMSLLMKEGANLSTFRSFWPVIDMNYSIYTKELTSYEKRLFLEYAIPLYIKHRHLVYNSHGYSSSSLQILADSNAHKKQGPTASRKLSAIFRQYKLTKAPSAKSLISNPGSFALMKDPIQVDDISLLIKHFKIKFEWHRSRQGKEPDFFLHLTNGDFFIGEAKHKKEQGGGQNDQMGELISFIRLQEDRPKFGYISFLDGIYFNRLIVPEEKSSRRPNKESKQSLEISQILEKNSANYFVNTKGMHEFLRLKLNG
jgi:hypothetical protein